jgi:hypothetical protein
MWDLSLSDYQVEELVRSLKDEKQGRKEALQVSVA